jgi:hypothetical protein
LDKSEKILNYSVNRYNICGEKKLSQKSKLKNKKKVEKVQFSKKSFKPDSMQLFHNISLNFNPPLAHKNSNKKEDISKIVFYSILLNDLLNKFITQNSIHIKSSEEKEEEKKRFLYQLYYCLGLAKIYILNFKENKVPQLLSKDILTLNKKKKEDKKLSNVSENSGIRFKTFMKLSQIIVK